MGQPIEGGSGEAFATEHLRPVLEWQISRHDQTQPFVGRADLGPDASSAHPHSHQRGLVLKCTRLFLTIVEMVTQLIVFWGTIVLNPRHSND